MRRLLLTELCEVDVVLDTNVLSHAENTGAIQRASAVAVLDWMRNSQVRWVLDDQGKAAPDPKTSLLFQEYRATLSPQSASLRLLIEFLSYQRVVFAPRPGQAIRASIRRLIPGNVNDRAVLGAAHGTSDRVLVSNDTTDFSDAVRDAVWGELEVNIITSAEAAA
ncbi:hypothetical protein NQ166_09490 [Microbacterium sp. zg.Y1090]|uniref:hypothetical protein n=1 Tax=Microbacterium wangruii TaxID=3049073 RepID=UPI00214D83CC|nr:MULTISPECIES: hypothetical protein [unclassified Microbacterium]MCR2819058.1 hypothetical protein [Microbacterium sp. zg.Y1090]WIM27361.1 hypothetical protein QNO26_09300 [Microbacterium sp. zg-Y1090]